MSVKVLVVIVVVLLLLLLLLLLLFFVFAVVVVLLHSVRACFTLKIKYFTTGMHMTLQIICFAGFVALNRK